MVAALAEERAARISIIPETEETALYYSAADIFVCTSRVESYPRVFSRRWLMGSNHSTPAFGIVEQVRDGVNGEFYKPGDAAELASKLNDFVLDKNKRENYQANAPLVLGSLTGFDEMINSYAEIFRESVSV
jgi:glycosyltransferase involved in cell wall biosynthesis